MEILSHVFPWAGCHKRPFLSDGDVAGVCRRLQTSPYPRGWCLAYYQGQPWAVPPAPDCCPLRVLLLFVGTTPGRSVALLRRGTAMSEAASKRQRHPRRLGRAVCDTLPRGRDDAFCLTTVAAEVDPGPTLISL
eukprot:COSAG01_NODE_20143_length_968_cov_3.073648_1_plen_134_part_00